MANEIVVHVIDDDAAVRDSIAFLLETADLTVRTHESAVAFLGDLEAGAARSGEWPAAEPDDSIAGVDRCG